MSLSLNIKENPDYYFGEFFRACREKPAYFLQILEAKPEWANATHPKNGDHILIEAMRGTILGDYTEADLIKILLDKGADPNGVLYNHRSLLHEAVSWGRYPFDLMQQLVDCGLDINMSCEGVTPLHLAAESCNLDGIIFLLLSGADCNVCTENGLTPLHFLFWYNPTCHGTDKVDEASRLLIEYGADPEARFTTNTGKFTAADMMKRWFSFNLLRKEQYNTYHFYDTFR